MEIGVKIPSELFKTLSSMTDLSKFRELEKLILRRMVSKTKVLNRKRIRDQKNLDGSSFAPRKRHRKDRKDQRVLIRSLKEKYKDGKKSMLVKYNFSNSNAKIILPLSFLKEHHEGRRNLAKRHIFGLSKNDKKDLENYLRNEIKIREVFFGK